MELLSSFTGRGFVTDENGRTTIDRTFYFKPTQDYETEFDIMALQSCPKIGDQYTYLNNASYVSDFAKQIASSFICTHIENLGKKADDEEDIDAKAKFYWIVKAQYADRQQISSSAQPKKDSTTKSPSTLTEPDKKMPPWLEAPLYSFTPVKIKDVPLYKAYDENGNLVWLKNAAGTWIENKIEKWGLKIDVSFALTGNIGWGPATNVVNMDNFSIANVTYNPNTLIMQPIARSKKVWVDKIPNEEEIEVEDNNNNTSTTMVKWNTQERYHYWDYKITFLYNPETWYEDIWNCGTKGKCYNIQTDNYNDYAEQIYKITLFDNDAMSGLWNYGNLNQALQMQYLKLKGNKEAGKERYSMGYEAVSSPVNLTSGGLVDRTTIEGGIAEANFIRYLMYPKYNFSDFFGTSVRSGGGL